MAGPVAFEAVVLFLSVVAPTLQEVSHAQYWRWLRAARLGCCRAGDEVAETVYVEQESFGFEYLERLRAGLACPPAVLGRQGADARRTVPRAQCAVEDATAQQRGEHRPCMSGTGRGTLLTGELGTWLREQREARGWARRDMARRLIQAGHDTGDTTMPSIDSLCTYIRRWEHGHGLTERYKLHYCTALAIPPAHFGQAPAHHSPGMPVPADSRLPTTVTVAYRGAHKSDLDGSTVEREMLMTAHESSDHAEQAAQPGIGDLTLEQLHADAGIDLAVARLRVGALDAAAVALEPAFSLPAAQRIGDVTIRLATARDELAAPDLPRLGAGTGAGRADRGIRPGDHRRRPAQPARLTGRGTGTTVSYE
jgi:hypothetical protein